MSEMPGAYDERVLRITERYVSDARAGKKPRLSDYLVGEPEIDEAIAGIVVYYHDIERHIPTEDDLPPASVLSARSRAALEQFTAHPSTLFSTLKGRRISPKQLAQALDLSPRLVMLLEWRCIDEQTIPQVLLHHLGQRLGYSRAAIQAYLEQPAITSAPRNASQARLYVEFVGQQTSDDRQQTSDIRHKISFRSALDSCDQLSSSQKASWHTIIERE